MADKESSLSLENARRVAKTLRPLSPKAKNDLFVAKNAGDYQSFQKVAFENRLNADSIWTGIDDIQQQTALGVDISINDSEQETPDSRSGGTAISTIGALAAGVLLDRKEGTYEGFQENSDEYGMHAKKIWEEEEKERLKNPNKFKPKPGRAVDAQEAYDRAHQEYHDMLVRSDPKKAKKWLSEHPENTSMSLALNKVDVKNKKLTYEELKKIRENHAKTIESEWTSRDPSKRSRDRVYMLTQAKEEINDHLVLNNPKAAEEWAIKHNDIEIQAAIERKRQRDEAQAIENQGRISRALGRNPAAKYAPTPGATPPQVATPRASLPILNPAFQTTATQATPKQGRMSKLLRRNPPARSGPPTTPSNHTTPSTQKPLTFKEQMARYRATGERPAPMAGGSRENNPSVPITAWTPIPVNTFPGTPPQNTLKNQGTPNTLEDAQEPVEDPRKRGLRSRLNYYSPSQIRARAIARTKARILNTKLGQRLQKSRLGRLGSKLNKLGGMASKATRRIKNLLNPLNYLLNLLKKSILGAIISAAVSVFTAVISFAVSLTVGAIITTIGIFSAAVTFIMGTIGLPLVIVIIVVAIMFLVFTIQIPCLIFCDPDGQLMESPYVGISYSIIAEDQDGRISNGEDLKYTILISHNRDEAQIPLEDITLYSLIPPGTIFVSATGNYDISEPGKISWKLYPENQTTQDDSSPNKTFVFNLMVDPDNDIVVSNRISLDGEISVIPRGDITPNDNYCQNNIYNYVLRNDLLPKNFGDPTCTLDTAAKRDQLYALLQQKDPQWADFWFSIVIPGESGYRPNAWARPVPDEDDPRDVLSDTGAWGLFQMGSSEPPGKLTNRNGTYRGDLTWPEQVDTAIARNKYLEGRGLLFKYWQVAIEYCRSGRMNEPQCRDM